MTGIEFLKVDKPTFFKLIQQQPEQYRFEYVRGRIMQQMAGGTRKHVRIAQRFIEIFSARLDRQKWIALPSDLAVDTGQTIRYADVVVEPMSGEPDALATATPAILVEVLSKSSEDRDLFLKAQEYLAMPSLQAYIVASQDEPLCFVWTRDRTGAFPTDGVELRGEDKTIDIPMLTSPIPLAEVYRGLLAAPPKTA